MALNINTNIGALGAAAAASSVNKSMETSMERLSTGLRINSSADDAAGMAITSRMESAVRGMNQAIRNAMDAQALIDTAEGAQSETMNLLQRMRELAVQGATDTNSQQDRTALNEEIIQLSAEIERIATTTTWAGQKLLDGSFIGKQFQIGAFEGETITVNQVSTRPADLGQWVVDSTAQATAVTDSASDQIVTDFDVVGYKGTAEATFAAASSAKTVAAAVNADTSNTGVSAIAVTKARVTLSADPAATLSLAINGGGTKTTIYATVVDADDLTALKDQINTFTGTTGVAAAFDGTNKAALILTEADGDNILLENFSDGGTATILQVAAASNYEGSAFGTAVTATSAATGANDVVVTGIARMSSINAFVVNDQEASGAANAAVTGYFGTSSGGVAALSKVSNVSVATKEGAQAAVATLDKAIEMVASSRSSLGAVSNRLDSTVANLTNIVGNTESSRARIEDADFAAESTNLAKSQILQQAATAMLAQANASKQGVLQLLQG